MSDYTVYDLEQTFVPEEYEAILRQAQKDDFWAAVLEDLMQRGA